MSKWEAIGYIAILVGFIIGSVSGVLTVRRRTDSEDDG